MPLFAKKTPKPELIQQQTTNSVSASSSLDNNNMTNDKSKTINGNAHGVTKNSSSSGSGSAGTNQKNLPPPDVTSSKPALVFHCQLAHGSPTGLITGFSSVRELYIKIAECYDLPVSELLFCTLNSHKVDMSKLLGGQIGLDDFIFAHRKGQPKEVDIVKEENALGLTITDNGSGYAFIKRIKEGSVIDRVEHVHVGDHIEKLNGQSMVGKRHYEVARLLKEIIPGSTFTLRLIEPLHTGFEGIGPRTQSRTPYKSGNYGSGKETIRFKANGHVEIEQRYDVTTQTGIDSINNLLESFMGINDNELATQIWDLGANQTNSMDFAEAIDNSDLESFGFTDDFIIELWGAITDTRRMK